ncbi:MAG: metalloregulator ArsR/SmtB family transcription factor [Planctomycetota bacterium]|nr:metalloregulator ArsR/SmtB family transcription factor [Planctomycetota bacterium]
MKQNKKAATECAERLKALSEPLRLRIVDLLRAGPLTVTQLADQLASEMVTTSHHLKILKHAGLVQSERRGRCIAYRLDETIFHGEVAPAKFDILDFGCCRLEIPRSQADSKDMTGL